MWLNKDPIGEMGGINLYGFIGNNPICYIDLLGLALSDCNKATCDDLRKQRDGISKALAALGSIDLNNVTGMKDLEKRLREKGIVTVGATHGLINGSLTSEGKKLPAGQQQIIKYFESTEFTEKKGNHDHPTIQTGMEPGEYARAWAEAEMSRLGNAVAELADEIKRRDCPEVKNEPKA